MGAGPSVSTDMCDRLVREDDVVLGCRDVPFLDEKEYADVVSARPVAPYETPWPSGGYKASV